PGREMTGRLEHPLYAGYSVLIPAGSSMKLVVDRVEKKKAAPKKPTGFLDRVEKFRSLQFRAPVYYEVSLRPALLTLADGSTHELRVTHVRTTDVIALHPKGSSVQIGESSVGGAAVEDAKQRVSQIKDAKRNAKSAWSKYRHPVVTLRLDEELPLAANEASVPPIADPAALTSITVPAGARARLLLLSGLSASDSKQGENFQAMLQEPIREHDHVLLPQGCVFRGHIARLSPPKRLSRAGSMQLIFDSVQLPGGGNEKVVASLSGVEADRQQPAKMDSEGGLRGGHQSKRDAVAAVAIAVVVGHLADEAVSSPIEAGASTVAGNVAGPLVGVGAGVLFYLAGRGKDVELPQYTEMEITFGRDLTVPAGLVSVSTPHSAAK
ncbi:MAG: putative peptidoglycan binding domain protein, partial [Bryobacterales bacterium]|nr:putative peptidoglycan binding domain protein [Bryobacterales bacterium]